MPEVKIERVDAIPVLVKFLQRMHLVEIIDRIWIPDTKWQGLSYGQLTLLFIVYVIHERCHRLCSMESWVEEHHETLRISTGWPIRVNDATDDRLGNMLGKLGNSEEKREEFQREMSSNLVQGFELPTDVARYDTTSFSVHHDKEKKRENSFLEYGYSKDKRPDLQQFKQGLGVLDPAGVPLLSQTIPGNVSDDPLYIPAWREMVATLGKTDFLYVADCKGASLETRATISNEGGKYLFPMPMTGDIPKWLEEQVLNLSYQAEEVYPKESKKENEPAIGQGFSLQRTMGYTFEDGTEHSWEEEWFVSQSYAHAKCQTKALDNRIEKAKAQLHSLRHKADESDEQYLQRAHSILEKYRVKDYMIVAIDETIIHTKKYRKPGRPTPNSRFEIIRERKLKVDVQIDGQAVQKAKRLAGWRPFVSNQTMTIQQTVHFYRDEWLVEHGIHRFKNGSLPTLPLWLHIPERIAGLMILLFVALQTLTLIEFVARRAITVNQQELAGLYPGNPTRTTYTPSAESLLHSFRNLHLIVSCGKHICQLHESLSPLQIQILGILQLPLSIYDFSYTITNTSRYIPPRKPIRSLIHSSISLPP